MILSTYYWAFLTTCLVVSIILIFVYSTEEADSKGYKSREMKNVLISGIAFFGLTFATLAAGFYDMNKIRKEVKQLLKNNKRNNNNKDIYNELYDDEEDDTSPYSKY